MSACHREEMLWQLDKDAAAFHAEWNRATREFAASLRTERAMLDEAERTYVEAPEQVGRARAQIDEAERRVYEQAEQARRRFETAAEEVRRRVRGAASD